MPAKHPSLSNETTSGHHLLKLAQLASHLTRANDPPPGNQIFRRGFTRLHEFHLGYLLAKGNVGN